MLITMNKINNALENFKAKFGVKTEQPQIEVAPENQAEPEKVIVTDYAVAQGADCLPLTGDEVEDRYRWIERTKLPELYHYDQEGTQIPNYFEQPVGMPMVFERAVENGLSVQGGYLTYREKRPKMEDEKDEYVYYPQNRVRGKLAEQLTMLAQGKVSVPESEFGQLSHGVKLTSYENHHDVKNACYYYQGQGYCVRVDPNNQKDSVQWYAMRPVVAELVDNKIVTTDVLFAENLYQPHRVLSDLQNSISLNHEIPLMYTKTPFVKPDDGRQM